MRSATKALNGTRQNGALKPPGSETRELTTAILWSTAEFTYTSRHRFARVRPLPGVFLTMTPGVERNGTDPIMLDAGPTTLRPSFWKYPRPAELRNWKSIRLDGYPSAAGSLPVTETDCRRTGMRRPSVNRSQCGKSLLSDGPIEEIQSDTTPKKPHSAPRGVHPIAHYF